MSAEQNDQGVLQYKCRRCGAVESNTHVPSIQQAMVELQTLGKVVSWGDSEVRIHDIHACKGGGLGFADLIGAVRYHRKET